MQHWPRLDSTESKPTWTTSAPSLPKKNSAAEVFPQTSSAVSSTSRALLKSSRRACKRQCKIFRGGLDIGTSGYLRLVRWTHLHSRQPMKGLEIRGPLL